MENEAQQRKVIYDFLSEKGVFLKEKEQRELKKLF